MPLGLLKGQTLNSWLESINLKLKKTKKKKTVWLPFALTSLSKPPANLTLRLHGPKCDLQTCSNCPLIARSDNTKYLGIYFDNDMKWCTNIGYVNRRLRKLIYIFSRLKRILNLKLMQLLYYALVQSVLLYGLPAWGGAYSSTLKPLITTQKILIRIVGGSEFAAHTEPIFKSLQILNFKQLLEMNNVKQILKEKLFTHPQHNIATRYKASKSLSLPLFRTTAAQNCYCYQGILSFNKLPNSIKTQLLEKPMNYCSVLKKYFLASQSSTCFK